MNFYSAARIKNAGGGALNRCQKNSFMGDGRRRRETENENGHNFGQFESFLVVLQAIRRGRSRNALQANCKHEKTFKCNQMQLNHLVHLFAKRSNIFQSNIRRFDLFVSNGKIYKPHHFRCD
jgi:hypothetical protein